MNTKQTDLTQGPILGHLFRLAIPTIGSSFMQMAYNLTDMVWLGRLGEDAVAAVGTAGFFVWFGISLLLIPRIGAEVGVSQSKGRRDQAAILSFVHHALFWALLLSVVYTVITLFFAPHLIDFFRIDSPMVNSEAVGYLRLVGIGFIFHFINPTFAGIYNGLGNSRSPFYYMTIGVVMNLVLDPLFIFGLGPVPAMGVKGAALATLLSQAVVWLIFFYRIVIAQELMVLKLRQFRFSRMVSKELFKLGVPVAAESALFASFAMVLTRMIAVFGPVPIAVQSIGAQIEALSWMTSSGFATALGSFTGQNFGARQWGRIWKGYKITLVIGTLLGLMVTLLFVVGGKLIFSLFLEEAESVALGVLYLKILAVSQVFMIYEITTRGAFNGLGLTVPPSLTGIVFTGLRIPFASLLIARTSLGLLSIWWAITLSSVVKGLVLPMWFILVLKNREKTLEGMPGRKLISLIPSRIRQQFFIKSDPR